jgi:formylglycine-generating enzyme required for sulfatase activity
MASSLLTIQRRPGQNQCYDESLGAEILPLRMMQIPAGTFLMGSPEDELDRLDREGPQHQVTVPLFFMAQYPVTQTQWRAVATLPQVDHQLDSEPSRFKGDLRPVEQVSWHDAVEFCDRLTRHSDRQYRLPTEAEWEYACRAGTKTPFHFGPTLSTDYANYDGSSEKYGAYGPGSRGERRGETTPVNQFEGANPYGLYDLHGNVWEWCQDPWHENYDDAPSDGSAWIAGGDSKRRVVRGGSWFFHPWHCRSAYRDDFNAEYRNNSLGFRVCCSAPTLSQ